MKINATIKTFFQKETSSGYLLLACAVLSFMFANTTWGREFSSIWNHPLHGHPLSAWINDGLMSVFFLIVGLELKHELLYGTLKSVRKALLPTAAAIGGMLVPILIYLVFNFEMPTWKGFGIPMATDIAFALAVLSILENKIPASLKIFLIALAVIDDIGAITVIAVFYTSDFNLAYFLFALLFFGILFLFGHCIHPNSSKGEKQLTILLLIGGLLLWWLISESGIHASISGVLVALCIPSRNGGKTAPTQWLQKRLHHPVNYLILPLFVLSNTAISLQDILPADGFSLTLLTQDYTLGIMLGLLIGKPIGIVLGSYMVIYAGLAELPKGMTSRHLIGIGFLGGIGFTMSIFITTLSFTDVAMIGISKVCIFISSLVAATIGAILIHSQKNSKN